MEYTGWVKLHRQIRDNRIYRNSKVLHAFIECVLRASHTHKTAYVGSEQIELAPGQFVMGYEEFARKIRCSTANVFRIFFELKRDNVIESRSTTKGTVVTIKSWELYQSADNENDNKLKTKRKQSESNKNIKNVKNKNIYNGGNDENVPPIKKQEGVETVGDILAREGGIIPTVQTPGITKSFQDTAFRCAHFLGIDLNDKEIRAQQLVGRFLRVFKLAEGSPEIAALVERARTYLVDYGPFITKTPAHKIMYFFDTLNRYRNENKTHEN